MNRLREVPFMARHLCRRFNLAPRELEERAREVGVHIANEYSPVYRAEVERIEKHIQTLRRRRGEDSKQDSDRATQEERLYDAPEPSEQHIAQVVDIGTELKQYLARHPEKLHDLTPRTFEKLIADILRDFGFETELTSAARDGGRDILAYLKNSVTVFLMYVECKKWAPERPVGIDIVQRVYGVHQSHGANKSLIVTTSRFTEPAKAERARYETLLELKDYEDLKMWLLRYRDAHE